MRLHDLLLDGAMRHPESIALHSIDSGAQRTYGAAALEMERIAAALATLGVKPGDRVGLFSPNRIEYPLAMFGIWRAGAISTHLSVQFGEQLDYYLGDATPEVLVYSGEHQQSIEHHHGAVKRVRHLICLDGERPGALDWQALIRNAGGPPADRVQDDDGAHLSWTSGSTGKPKGALIGHGITARACRSIAERLRITSKDVTYGPTSLSSSYHLVANLLPGLFAQATVGLVGTWNAARAWEDMERTGVTIAPANSTLLGELLNECRTRGRAPRALRLVLTGGVPTPPALKRAWRDEFSITLAESYGLSELGGFVGLGYPEASTDAKLAASGPSLPDREVRVFDPKLGVECRPGQVGEIAVSGGCMIGYWGRPEQSAQVMRGRWLFTGDLGFLDRDGYVHVRGRASETLIVDGESWYPRDAEDAALEHPSVLHAALVGVSDGAAGHRPVLFIALRPGMSASATELASHVATRLGCVPSRLEVRILAALPLTPTSKVDKVNLRVRASSG